MNNLAVNQFNIQALLEQRFQECLDLVSDLQHEVEVALSDQDVFQPLLHERILPCLRDFCPRLYKLVGDTLFRLLLLSQPEDCEGKESINFYYWPGYHSYIADRRIFVSQGEWNFGVGICAAPGAERFEPYDDCSQARWYHYLIPQRNASNVIPGDVHRWLRLQQPRCPGDPKRLVNSLTVTAEPPDSDERDVFPRHQFPDHQVLRVATDTRNSARWGEQFTDFVNSMELVRHPGWKFPDRRPGGDERQAVPAESLAKIRAAQSKMHAVWLHAAFCRSEPVWLGDFIQRLVGDDETRPAGKALREGLADKVAQDWGDASHGRPPFKCWSYLSLHAWLAPTSAPAFDPPFSAGREQQQTIASKTVGSAEFLSSVTLRPLYFGHVRPWLSSVYGMVRNAEISMLLNSRQREARAAMLAGPYFAHELKKLIDEGSTTLLRDVAKNSPEIVRTRRFILYSLCSLSNLAYAFINAVTSGDSEAFKREKMEFLEPLRKLHRDGELLAALRYVAEQVYESVRHEGRGRVSFPEPWTDPGRELEERQHRSCFLLVAEMISSYCKHEKEDREATWRAFLEGESVVIELAGETRAQRNPASMTFARLNVFLRALKIGEADVAWDKERMNCTYTVRVDYAQTFADPSDVKRGETFAPAHYRPKRQS